jgi:hypothetical protein
MAELERHFAQDGRWTQVAAPERQRLVELRWADVRKLKEDHGLGILGDTMILTMTMVI